MTVGGNAKAREAFGEALLNLKDLKTKYTSRNALSYKERLLGKAKAKAKENIDVVEEEKNKRTEDNLIDFEQHSIDQPSLIDFSSEPPLLTPSAPSTEVQTDLLDDLFKPVNIIPAAQIKSSSVFDDLMPQPTADDLFLDELEKPGSKENKKRTFKPKKGHTSKLGARKVQSTIFRQQEELARREEKMRQEGVNEESIGRSSQNHLLIHNDEPIPKLQPPTSSRLIYQPADEKIKEEKTVSDRLGIMSLKSTHQNKKEDDDDETFACDKFGNAKAISSDQYFGRNEYDSHKTSANSTRLAQFQGSQSISSDQFFGRKPSTNSSRPFSKKLLNVASKGATKLQNMLAELEVR